MSKYTIQWSKTYHATGTEELVADSEEKAKDIAKELIGDWEGSMQYDPDKDTIEVVGAQDTEEVVEVIQLPPDYFGRPRLMNIKSKRIYADVNCGINCSNWHSTSQDGEPDLPLRENIQFKVIERKTNEK